MALLEAIHACVPVVASRVGGIPDVVSDEEALLVPPEDPVALASAIRSAFGNPDGGRQRALRAQARIADDSQIDTWVDSYRNVYDRALSSRSNA